ncbi:uncharacterized protein LOC131968778 isoform X1 [Centropristis striata]|uniref:uncharacterized protein LOC131968778 isoform X1 n=1 Tax=Centropristis striata TaxID=184440 RepID=UPI0027E0C35F|nr:uncharacterized protein LOC131968778 isoform X1 [Centropristis striata]
MVELRWTIFFVMLQFAGTEQNPSYIMARFEDEVTLPCDNVIKNQNQCTQTSWFYTGSEGDQTAELISLGQIDESEIAEDISNRLSVTADCSLVIKDVTYKDVGHYSCRQFNRAGQQQGGDALVVLSVIFIYEKQNGNQTTLTCYVFRYDIHICEHTVHWLFDGNNNDTETTTGSCSASVTFPTPHPSQKSKFYESLKCNVTDYRSEKTLLFSTDSEGVAEGIDTLHPTLSPWWWIIIVLVGLAALITAVVVVKKCI